MQTLLTTDSHALALRFRDYAKAQFGLTLEVVNIEPHFEVRCPAPLNEALHAQLDVAVQAFVQNPDDAQFVQASWAQGQAEEVEKLPLFSLQSLLTWLKRAPVTALVTALCIVVYALSFLIGERELFLALHFPETGQYGEVWRFFSHALVHLSFSHIAFNLTWWLIFASRIEQKCGSGKLVQLFLSCALISGIVQNAFSGAAFFGLSGVVYGVLGYIYVCHRADPQQRFALPTGFVYMIIIGIVLGFAGPLYGAQVGNAAHIAGLVVGALSGGIDCKRTEKM
ncbi:rhomboid family intramembrane serine protease [Pasteurellaceae bacterium HPA106]|uniref:rhomboid family intramembrane serine protease n=1 Tax=Spirabiliibacterium pneumoniae TaxID=221400 RepID=UPI001AAD3628|nr:rhomboid family intramembrane serine protease [Spirabiliibacterium pneumoniae]MBE2896023.1 rhomboid family intramembrane serine protease [Spirabiliibacterium pneumoniae]